MLRNTQISCSDINWKPTTGAIFKGENKALITFELFFLSTDIEDKYRKVYNFELYLLLMIELALLCISIIFYIKNMHIHKKNGMISNQALLPRTSDMVTSLMFQN